MNISIPRIEYDDPGPGWIPSQWEGKPCKPKIKCNCGKVTGIGLHHVHADGRVTESYFHAAVSEFTHGGKTYKHEPGCGWHVFLTLLDYDLGDFPPVE